MGIRLCLLVWIWSGGPTSTPRALCLSGQITPPPSPHSHLSSKPSSLGFALGLVCFGLFVDTWICAVLKSVSSLSRFHDEKQTAFPSSLRDGQTARQYFLKLLVQQIQDSAVFEGPDGSKNLALDYQGTGFCNALFDSFFMPQSC